MYKVTLINYNYDDESYLAALEIFEEDFAVGRDGLREWEAPNPPVSEEYIYEFPTKEEAELYVSGKDVQEYFEVIEVIEI